MSDIRTQAVLDAISEQRDRFANEVALLKAELAMARHEAEVAKAKSAADQETIEKLTAACRQNGSTYDPTSQEHGR